MGNKQGVNPVTIRPLKTHPGKSAVLSRLGIGTEDKMQMMVTVAFMDEEAIKKGAKVEDVTQAAVVDEASFIDAMGHLFPHGELQHAHLEGGPMAGMLQEMVKGGKHYKVMLDFIKGLAREKTESEIDDEDDVLENDTAVTFYSDVIQEARDVLNLIGEKPEGS
jgi:hypothetical protein